MSRALEFVQHHPLLIGAAGVLAVAAIVVELRHRMSSAAAVGPSDAVRLLNGGALIIDVRAAEAYSAGHIIDARNIPKEQLAQQTETLKKYKEKPVILCCDSGVTSAAAAAILQSAGFTKVVNLRGGIEAWKQENLPLVTGGAETKGGGKNKGAK